MPESHTLDLLLRSLEQRVPLSESDRKAVLRLPFKVRSLDPSAYLVREGDPPERCGVLLSGFAYRQKVTGDGQRQIMAILIPGEAVDLQNLFFDVADHSVQMLTRGEVAIIARKDLIALVRAVPSVNQAVLMQTLVEGSISREWVLNVGRRDAKTRMAHLLCEFAVRMQAQALADGEGYELPITQEQLADALGMTPVHVNRTLKALEQTGLILRNKRTISFPSWERMQDVADFNRRYLHLRQVDPAGA